MNIDVFTILRLDCTDMGETNPPVQDGEPKVVAQWGETLQGYGGWTCVSWIGVATCVRRITIEMNDIWLCLSFVNVTIG